MAKLSVMAAKKRDQGTLGMSTASGGAGESTPKASPAERNAKGFFAKKKAAAREAAARAGSPMGASGAQPWTKKLRPSLQKLRIAGGSKERAASSMSALMVRLGPSRHRHHSVISPQPLPTARFVTALHAIVRSIF